MNTIQKRFLLFLGGCIPARLALVGLAKYLPNKYLPYLGYITLLMALGFYTSTLPGQERSVKKHLVNLFGGANLELYMDYSIWYSPIMPLTVMRMPISSYCMIPL